MPYSERKANKTLVDWLYVIWREERSHFDSFGLINLSNDSDIY